LVNGLNEESPVRRLRQIELLKWKLIDYLALSDFLKTFNEEGKDLKMTVLDWGLMCSYCSKIRG